jgi:hypothetical protein
VVLYEPFQARGPAADAVTLADGAALATGGAEAAGVAVEEEAPAAASCEE